MPAAYLKQMLEIAAERGVDPERMLEGTGLTLAQLSKPDLRIPAPEAAQGMFRAIEMSGDRGFGLEFGLRTKPTAHGYVGFAAMSCETLSGALEMVQRYVHLRQRDVALRVFAERGELVLELSERHEMGPLRQMYFEGLVVTFYRITGFLLGEDRPDAEIRFDWPEPDYFGRFRDRLPRVRFGMPSVQLRMAEGALERKLVMADADAVARAVEQCEREMALLDAEPDHVVERVRAQLVVGEGGLPDLETVASRLAMSARTLKRKLQERGYGFRELVDEARFREASRLLENPDLSIARVAASVGYSDPACFTRAFRRWSGTTPSRARAGLGASG